MTNHPPISPSAAVMLTFDAVAVSVYDGDTFHADVTLRPGLVERWNIRLARVNCPEMKSGDPKAVQAREFTKAAVVGPLVVRWRGIDNYGGRVDAECWFTAGGVQKNLSDELLAAGLAVPYP